LNFPDKARALANKNDEASACPKTFWFIETLNIKSSDIEQR